MGQAAPAAGSEPKAQAHHIAGLLLSHAS